MKTPSPLHALLLACLAATSLHAPAAIARKVKAPAPTLDLAKPADMMQLWRKVQCSTVDGKPAVYHWSGKLYSRMEGERDRHLFNVEGMNVRQCGTFTDPVKGTGVRLVSREIMVYIDPKTGQKLERWTNPWSGKEVEVLPVANDPVNQGPIYNTSMNLRETGGMLHYLIEVPLFYRNPLAGDFQDQVGNHYHAVEMFNFFFPKAEALDATRTEMSSLTVSWVRIGPWLPWMEMGSRPGMVFVNASGDRVAGIADLPQVLRDAIANRHPEYATPPPLDDKRPNETSWTYFRKVIEKRRAAGPGPAPLPTH
ncbi:MAG: DUF1838 family protein [Gammaproteobacteria bacterium]